MDAQKFLEALGELEAQKGISKESILEALKESLRKAYAKSLGGGDDADIRVIITEEPAEIKMELVKKIVNEEDITDDYLEISLEDAKKINKKAKVGEECHIEVDVDTLARMTALIVKSVLRQKLQEAEKMALYDTHKDKIGEMITGIVEKCDDHGCVVNIGRTSLFLSRKDLIGDEMFNTGASIRLYVSDVSNKEKGPMIHVSRSDEGFLRRLFEEEVREIYDGTVIIKSIAREAGIRSKIAVYSNDPNVDSVGACIGVNGASIQKIVGNLGSSRDKEKIDIITYSPNDALFIIDAIRPATVSYIYLDKEEKKAIVIVPNEQLSLAIGRRGANARIACRLTGWHIDVKTEADMPNFDVQFKPVATIQEEEKERAQKEKYEKYLSQIKASRVEETKTETGLEKAKPHKITDEEVKVEEAPVVAPVVEEKVEVVEEKPVEVKPTVVKTTTTLESLEASLETEKKNFKATQKTSKRPHKITEEEVEHEKVEVKPVEKKEPQMEIYSKEELEELEKEELYEDEYVDEDEDIDYDEFDQYYDDDDK